MIGVAIGRYVIQKKLAEGGMGAVYLAKHERLDTKKVVKILLAEYSKNTVIQQRFTREATAASRLKQRHIVAIDDFGQLPDGQLFLMMPFLDGYTLDEHLRQSKRLTQHHALHIIVQVCRALQHLHDAGIVHRDLKPGNIFLTHTDENPYEVTLIDLGIARDLAEDSTSFKTQTGIAMGTPGYMAVEQYGRAGDATPAADVYATAIITWEMITGELPWGRHDPRVLYHLQMTEKPEPPADAEIPLPLLTLLRAALSTNPADRPPSARAFAVAFASATPAIPPHVPSGAEILTRFAKGFVQRAAPDHETVRHASNSDNAVPLLWPQRHTQVPSTGDQLPALSISIASANSAASEATRGERPSAMSFDNSRPTTLSASSGVAVSIQRPRNARRMLALLLIGTGVLAGLVTFALVKLRSETSASEHLAPAGSAATSEIAAPMQVPSPLIVDAAMPTSVVDAPVIEFDVTADAGAPPTATPDAAATPRSRPAHRKPRPTIAQPPKPPKPEQDLPPPRKTTFDPNAVEE